MPQGSGTTHHTKPNRSGLGGLAEEAFGLLRISGFTTLLCQVNQYLDLALFGSLSG